MIPVMTRSPAELLSNAALCITPLVVLPVAGVTAIGGPCASVRGAWSGFALFVVAIAGMSAVVLGWLRWARLDSLSAFVKLAKIASSVAGLGIFVLNLYFAFFAGLNLFGMALSRIHG